eukprot:1149089-Heterocapsa_arctica.AAC.1
MARRGRPPPLRSRDSPMGLPNLNEKDQERAWTSDDDRTHTLQGLGSRPLCLLSFGCRGAAMP